MEHSIKFESFDFNGNTGYDLYVDGEFVGSSVSCYTLFADLTSYVLPKLLNISTPHVLQ